MAESETEVQQELSLKSRPPGARYAILGCGSVGREVAKKLKQRDRELFIVDKDESRVRELRSDGYEAYVADIREVETVGGLRIEDLEAVLILSSDPATNEEAVRNISKQSEGTSLTVVVRAVDPVSEGRLDEVGASMVIRPSSVISDAAVRLLDRAESAKSVRKLDELISGAERFGIILHNNPDPDTMAGGLALKRIAENHGVEADLLYSGRITHQENRAMVNLLDIELHRLPDEDRDGFLETYDTTAFVEHSIPGENNPLSEGFHPTIVLDHHEVELDTVDADFVEIRTDAGSVSTILTKYIQDLDLSIDDKLAAALLYGIRVDTNQFKRNTHTSDLTAAAFLNPWANRELLDRLETPPMSPETLDVLGKAIRKRALVGSYLISNVGMTQEKDALSQAADYLLQLEGISTVLVYAITEDTIQVSARNKDFRLNIGDVLKEAFSDIGSAGGHSSMAGAQIPIEVFGDVMETQALLRLVEESMTSKFLAAVGVERS